MDARILGVDLSDRLDRLDRVASGLLLPRRDGEGQSIHDDVVDPHAPLAHEGVDEPGRDAHLVLGRAGLALLVDGEGDHGGTVLLDERHDAAVARLRAVAILEVHRVDHRPTADELHPGLKHRRFGRVDDEGQGGGAGEPRHDLAHVGDSVTADVVDADVKQVGALAHLASGDVDAVIPALLEHRGAERERAVRVGALTDREIRRVLGERHVLVQTRDAVVLLDRSREGACAADAVDDGLEVLGGRAAASAHEAQPELLHELLVRRRQLVGGERIAGAIGPEHGQARVGHAHHRNVGELRQMAQVLAHLVRTGRAVQADHVDAERLESGQGCRDLATHEHGARGFDCHLDEDG